MFALAQSIWPDTQTLPKLSSLFVKYFHIYLRWYRQEDIGDDSPQHAWLLSHAVPIWMGYFLRLECSYHPVIFLHHLPRGSHCVPLVSGLQFSLFLMESPSAVCSFLMECILKGFPEKKCMRG